MGGGEFGEERGREKEEKEGDEVECVNHADGVNLFTSLEGRVLRLGNDGRKFGVRECGEMVGTMRAESLEASATGG